jgi:GT2 family glycosyltransferase
MAETAAREAVSVVVPFAGDASDARATLAALQRIALLPDDEVIVVDNSSDGVLGAVQTPPRISVVRAPEQPSSYYARNVGTARVRNEWVLFTDSDCLPSETLLDDYFVDPIDHEVGAVAGAVLLAGRMKLVGRYKAFRRHLDQKKSTRARAAWAVTANLLVRRAAWADLGGFSEGIRSGGDIDFCLRLAATGWQLSYQPKAYVKHVHSDSLKAHAASHIRYGGAHVWLRRRYPDLRMSRPLAAQLPLSAAGALRRAVTADLEWSLYHLLDGLTAVMLSIGKVRGNRAPIPEGNAEIALVADGWPAIAQDGGRAALSMDVASASGIHLEARRRPIRMARQRDPEVPGFYMEDDSLRDYVESLAWLLAHRPKETARYVIGSAGTGRRATRLARIAPAARRIVKSGATTVRAFDHASAGNARALAHLTGATYDE